MCTGVFQNKVFFSMTSHALGKALFRHFSRTMCSESHSPGSAEASALRMGELACRSHAVHVCKNLPQTCHSVTSVCSFCVLKAAWRNIMSHLCVQVCWLFLKHTHTHTQIASPQVTIYLLVGSKFILRTNLNIFMLAKSILERVKIAREAMWGTLFLSSFLK